MEELATEMVLLERSSSTKLRIGISFGSVILTNRDAVVDLTSIQHRLRRKHPQKARLLLELAKEASAPEGKNAQFVKEMSMAERVGFNPASPRNSQC